MLNILGANAHNFKILGYSCPSVITTPGVRHNFGPSIAHHFPMKLLRYIIIIIISSSSILTIIYFLKPICSITGVDRPLGLQEVEAPIISRQSSCEGGKVVSPKLRPPLLHRRHAWYSFLLEAGWTPKSQCGRKFK